MDFGSVRLTGKNGQSASWRQEAESLAKKKPRHLLFLCVGNSARSQMAEGITRHLAPAGVRVDSAGSRPSEIRPEAIRVLGEIGIDASAQHAKGLDAIPLDAIDAVITLCREEVCPLFPRPVFGLHWPLPDPAAVEGDEETRLRAFREVRDELRARLGLVFS